MKSSFIRILTIVILFNINFYAQVLEIKPVQKHSGSFAIIVDNLTYDKCKSAIHDYKNAIENDGLSTFILVDNWQTPDIVKKEIERLYKENSGFEGVVFIGDIPIPMVIQAQHMTSAYKLAEDRYPLTRTGVPSDRFYDDFDLKFNFIQRDTVNTLQYYYSLDENSPQRIEREIYSARIIPQVKGDSNYELINKFLAKVVAEKKKSSPINNMFVFTGHGYYSNSLAGWADERLSIREQFPQLYHAGNRVKHYNHAMGYNMKEVILRELQKKDLDVALFHAHGAVDMQLLNQYPRGENPQSKIDEVKLYLRSKIRSAKESKKNIDEAKEYFQKWLDVPDSWFDGAFVDSVIAADSLLNYGLDIYSQDIAAISPQAKFVMFDQCFNGSFHKEDYVAGAYIFGNGNVIVAEGNSVNSLQDKWANEYLGMLNFGVRVGERHRLVNMLESHLFGDPTFRFVSFSQKELELFFRNANTKNNDYWMKLLKDKSATIREMAVRILYEKLGKSFDKELVNIYKNDESINVRLHALKFLAQSGGNEFHETLKLSIKDSYEMIRKYTSIWMGEVGKEEYLPYLVEVSITDESPRVPFNAKSAMSFISSEKSIELTEKYFEKMPDFKSKESNKNIMLNSFKRNIEWVDNEIMSNIKSDTLKIRNKLQEIKTFRNYKFHKVVPWLIEIAKDRTQDEKIVVQIIETLGWFNLSFRKNLIIDFCNEVIADANSQSSIKSEALRTKNRLTTGLNNLMIP
ncbi:MAG: hypothetical protein Q8N03_10145 [Ignavibacteria bacterium]|nr:hypothetical protein [Ignavibacteria bacterium]